MENNELVKLKQRLYKHINKFIDKETLKENHELGWVGENLAECVTSAAFAVLMSARDVQVYLQKEGKMENVIPL